MLRQELAEVAKGGLGAQRFRTILVVPRTQDGHWGLSRVVELGAAASRALDFRKDSKSRLAQKSDNNCLLLQFKPESRSQSAPR